MDKEIIAAINNSPTLSTLGALDGLIEELGKARIVLLGEASHGTSDFYTWRAEITTRLIQEKGFFLIGVEGDWSSCYRTNLFIAGASDENLAPAAVLNASFERWPTWMWANREMARLVGWLRDHNLNLPAHAKPVKFYGLDLYGLWESLEKISRYLENVDPQSAQAAREAYECFEPFRGLEECCRSARPLVPDSRRDEVVSLLGQTRERSKTYPEADDAPLNARQLALATANADNYYREFLTGGAVSWNVRDRHLAESVRHLLDWHDGRYHIPSKMIIWAHNAHSGDARATDMIRYGMVNLGQLLREDYPGEVKIVGFDSYRGHVIAATAWEGLMEDFELPEAREGSWEHLFHQAGRADRIVTLGESLNAWQDQRAVGVVYDPEHETGNYVPTLLSGRYDYLVFIDHSEALHPLSLEYESREVPETYPSGV